MRNIIGATKSDMVSEREKMNMEVAYRAALEGMVLLENNGVLPLKSKKVALYGAGAVCTVKGGTGSGEVNERRSISIYKGMKDAGFEIVSEEWLADYMIQYEEAKEKYDAHCRKLASNIVDLEAFMDVVSFPFVFPVGPKISNSECCLNDEEAQVHKIENGGSAESVDTAIYVVARQAGESGDKKLENGDFDLMPEEIEHLKALKAMYKEVVLVINSGSSMNLSTIDDLGISAVIFFCQQGMEGGRAFADIISGKVSPSGKLTDTWAKKYDDIPYAREYSYLSGDVSKEYYKEDIYVGYRYFDTYKVEPRYAFGYGLSYTQFDVNVQSAAVENAAAQGGSPSINLAVEVANTGAYVGKEVVQVYVSAPGSNKEYQRLVAFAKTRELEPGESQVLEIEFPMEYCKSYHEDAAAYVLDAGDYIVRVGNASDNTVAAAIVSLDERVILTQCKNICKVQEPFEKLDGAELENALAGVESISVDVPRFEIKAADFASKKIEYAVPDQYHSTEVDAVMDKLSIKEMVDVCVGTGIEGMFSATGNVALGTVGRTTSKFFDKGLVNVNLSDGPAGIRLLRRSAIRGKYIRMVDYMMGFLQYLPAWMLKVVMADGKKDDIWYQYCTAFPVGTSLAQSWNTELCEEVGRAIATEMDEFNVTYWLAPAMNIHRNPLCGRNFEYYSEDPVVSGKIAAALTKGVQGSDAQKAGKYVTIKHFAANNQEDNRNKCDSILSERALREIYLRGFEICVKESGAKSVMTSYNLVNGVYTPNSGELVNDVLRCEWGFDGVVMTDWYSTKKDLAENDIAIAVGNDMIMPGGGSYKKAIFRGLKKGTVTEQQIRTACANVVRQILESDVSKKYWK